MGFFTGHNHQKAFESQQNRLHKRGTMEDFDIENPLTSSQEHQSDMMPALFAAESDHMSCKYYFRSIETRDLDVSVRQEAAALILKNSEQREECFIFDTQTIQQMELLILGALKWRMHSITPFSFVHFFLSIFKLKDPPLRDALKARAKEIIFKAQNGEAFQLLECYPAHINGRLRVVSSSDTPVNVLDRHCSSSESDKTISNATTTTV